MPTALPSAPLGAGPASHAIDRAGRLRLRSARPGPGRPPDASVSMSDPDMLSLLRRIADALERMVPPARPSAEPEHGAAFVWHAEGEWLEAVPVVSRVDLALL